MYYFWIVLLTGLTVGGTSFLFHLGSELKDEGGGGFVISLLGYALGAILLVWLLTLVGLGYHEVLS